MTFRPVSTRRRRGSRQVSRRTRLTCQVTSKRGVDAAAQSAAIEFGRRVKARRTELGVTLEGLAADSTLHWSYIGHVERGAANLTLVSILRVADLLDVDPGALLEGMALDETS